MEEKWTITAEAQSSPEPRISQTLHVRDKRLRKIRRHIFRALVFLLHADFRRCWTRRPSGDQDESHHEVIVHNDDDRSKLYYVTITIWYVLKVCPEALQPDEDSFLQLLSDRLDSIVRRLPRDDADMGSANGVKAHLLRWYHHESTLKIRQYLADNGIGTLAEANRAHLQQRLETCRRAAQKGLTNKIRAEQPYTSADEPCDRLSFLSLEEELGFETKPANPTSCISLSRKRINDRDWSTTVNPAILPREATDSTQPIPRSPPWETNSLCHHAHMLIWRDVDPDETEPYRARCYEFLTAEVALVESWERGSGEAMRSWFRIEAACVLATTLVLVRKKRLAAAGTGAVRSDRGSSDDRRLPPSLQRGGTESQHDQGADHHLADIDGGVGQSDTPLQTSQVYESQAFSTGGFRPRRQESFNRETGSASDIWRKQLEALHSLLDAFRQSNPSYGQVDWKAYRPTLQYHPDTFVNSRDDTPELYTDLRMAKITLRSQLKAYLGDKMAAPRPPDADGIADRVPVDCLHHISVTDIMSGQLRSGYTCRTTGRLSLDTLVPGVAPGGAGGGEVATKLRLINAMRTGLSLDSEAKGSGKSATEAAVAVYAAFLDKRFVSTDGSTPILTKELKQDYDQLIARRRHLITFFGDETEVTKARRELHAELTKILDDSVRTPKLIGTRGQLLTYPSSSTNRSTSDCSASPLSVSAKH